MQALESQMDQQMDEQMGKQNSNDQQQGSTSMAQRIALVTGAGSGIGAKVSKALAAQGWRVVLAGRRLAQLQQQQAEILADGGQADVQVADVSDPASVRALFEQIEASHGRLDLLFNNAGIFPKAQAVEDITDDDWLQIVSINLNGAFFCTREAVRLMKRQQPQGGRIINNGSISAHAPRPNSIGYTTTKHAMTGLTRSTSLDGRAFNIACGQIDIGNAASDMTAQMTAGILQPNGQRMVEPTMDAHAVADAVVYMAGLPLLANVLFMTVMATAMPFVGRG